MKLKNNKGFAISTLLYGLSIMGFLIVIILMSLMSSNRVNTSSFVSEVEDELNRFSLTENNFQSTTSTDGSQEYYVPYGQAGWYKIELWGAAGGNKGSYHGGYGAYTSGLIYLEENTHLYFYIGTRGNGTTGGKNNAGNGNSTTAGGGGATDVRLISGSYRDLNSMKSRIMVAAGGGGATSSANGGNGGDLQGYTGNGSAGGAGQILNAANPFPIDVGSGGGYQNGLAAQGGSSYISGYAGGSSYTFDDSTSTLLNQQVGLVSIYYKNPIYYDGSDETRYGDITGYIAPSKGYSFLNGYMISGINDGDGKASIQRIVTNTGNIEKKTNLNNVKKIVDCVDKDSASWKEIQAISQSGQRGGVNFAKESGSLSYSPTATNPNNANDGKLDTTATISTSTAQNCLTLTFASNINLDEIAVWHKAGNIAKHSLKVCYSTSDSNCLALSEFDGIDSDYIIETTNGLHYSAYRSNPSVAPQDGIYYIIPVSNEKVTFTTGDSTSPSSDMRINLKAIDGTRMQKWRIENIGGNNYTIVETQNYNSLQLIGTDNVAGDALKAQSRTNGVRERWQITPTKNGQYVINSPLGIKLNYTGGNLKTALSTTTGQSTKFYLVNVDY